MADEWLLYGATGFTGAITARLAKARGLRPILGGRNAAKLKTLADELGFEYRAFSLNQPHEIDAGLADVKVVMHAAGPFVATARPMVEGCLRGGTHYLDITGELTVFQAIAARDAEAQARGVMLLPGSGFDVAPTDCLAAHLKQRLPSATRLALAFQVQGRAGVSRGTAASGVGMLPQGNPIRRDGRLVYVPFGSRTRLIDFGDGPVNAVLIPWGDVFTAYYSTGIPNIEAYLGVPRGTARLLRGIGYLRPLAGLSPVQSLLKRAVKLQRPGPTAEQRARTHTSVWGEVADDQGRRAVARLYGPEPGYTWTPDIMLTAVQRVLAGDAPPGYQTPATAFGPDFILATQGVRREDVV